MLYEHNKAKNKFAIANPNSPEGITRRKYIQQNMKQNHIQRWADPEKRAIRNKSAEAYRQKIGKRKANLMQYKSVLKRHYKKGNYESTLRTYHKILMLESMTDEEYLEYDKQTNKEKKSTFESYRKNLWESNSKN